MQLGGELCVWVSACVHAVWVSMVCRGIPLRQMGVK